MCLFLEMSQLLTQDDRFFSHPIQVLVTFSRAEADETHLTLTLVSDCSTQYVLRAQQAPSVLAQGIHCA